MALRAAPIHRSLIRSNLFLGCDRELIMLSATISAALIFSGMTRFSIITGIFLWFASLFLLRMMAKADPQMRQVFQRYRQYPKQASARSTPFCQNNLDYK